MTFKEFHNQARAIAEALGESDGHVHATNCAVDVWDYDDGRMCIKWCIWDADLRESYHGGTAEAALALYHAEIVTKDQVAIEQQLAEVGSPTVEAP